LCQHAAETIAGYLDIPARFVCIYLYDPRGTRSACRAALMDLDFPQEMVHQAVVPARGMSPLRPPTRGSRS